MRPLAAGFICVLVGLGNLSCSVNILSTFANQKTNESLYESAQSMINQGDYNGALTAIGDMTGAYPSQPKVLELKASAYGGLCGFQFFPFITALSGIGGTFLFPFLLKNFDAGVATNIDNCVTAQTIMESIGTISERTADENFFIASIAFAKIGNILSYYGDVGHTGTATAGFDPCPVGGARAPGGAITDSDAREIGTGISLAIANLTAVVGKINLGSGQLTAMNNVCTAIGAATCGKTIPSAFSPAEVIAIRTLVNESTVVGLGSNCAGDVVACACP